MASRIVMSKLSPTMEEGRVLKWVKQEGDPVESGDVVVEVETDKATMEVEALGSGVLRKILVEEDTTVPTGTTLGVVAAEDEDISALLEELGAAALAAPAAAAASQEPATSEPSAAVVPGEAPAPAGDGGRLKASPLARRMADDRGIRLEGLRGTGPGGRIIKRDIEAAASAGIPAPEAMAPAIDYDIPYERVELSQLRKAIARNLIQSLGPIPHFFLTREIDMGEVLKLRGQLNEALAESGTKIGVNDIIVKTAAQALSEHPDVNVSFAGDHIRRFTRVDVGIAVALPDGLITPVLRDAAAKGLRQISAESRELIARARERKLAPEDYQGATFTISNLGMYGIDEFTAIINPPAATILAVGATQEKPVAVDGAVEIRPRMRVTLSCDHRAVDGAMGAEFLATFAEMLENPLRLVL
ncbi:MAG: pyruvate dehydrogenase complex dihydrolipoamide acetyltransferase [Gemmatimonadetes bacterium]|nr:pyruvate dehydrogenase complex dihydrolipoamide acetyltransferase [Gemmatimonadota bacterium]NIO32153.1 pyruvate dehydrogenase complex dihydrolipoamide acetyltransferase [Gemmatimonadota bacterium]